jgi:hypothetical protein
LIIEVRFRIKTETAWLGKTPVRGPGLRRRSEGILTLSESAQKRPFSQAIEAAKKFLKISLKNVGTVI